jgi:hypothetical protein
MKVFVFDLLAYGENLDHLKNGGTELPYPLSKQHFRPEVAVRTYAEHLEAWEGSTGWVMTASASTSITARPMD